MANEQNLRPYKKGELSSEEAKKRGSKGGKASVQSRRQQKTIKKALQDMLRQPAQNWSPEKAKYTAKILGCDAKDVDTHDVINASLLRGAVKGNVASIKELFDRVEGKPMQAIDHKGIEKAPISIHLSGLKQ